MNNYGKAALLAVEICTSKKISPVSAWRKATLLIFGNSAAQKRSAPKTVFLNLCQEGYIKNISPGDYTRSKTTSGYVTNAIDILSTNKNQKFTPLELWNKVQNKGLVNQYHMDVIITLWENNLIKLK